MPRSHSHSSWDIVTFASISRAEWEELRHQAKVRREQSWRTLGWPIWVPIFTSPRRRMLIGISRWFMSLVVVVWLAAVVTVWRMPQDGVQNAGAVLFAGGAATTVFVHLIAWFTPDYRLRSLCVRRTRLLERHLRGLSPRASEQIGDEMEARFAHWNVASQGRSLAWRVRVAGLFPLGQLVGGAFAMVVPIALLASLAHVLPKAEASFVFVLSIWAGTLAGSGISKRVLARLDTVRNSRRCPDCCYPLDDIPPAISREHAGGAFVGPRRCPECGSPWPLIPPPARDQAVRSV